MAKLRLLEAKQRAEEEEAYQDDSDDLDLPPTRPITRAETMPDIASQPLDTLLGQRHAVKDILAKPDKQYAKHV